MLHPRPRVLSAIGTALFAASIGIVPMAHAAEDVVRATTTYSDASRILAGQVLLWEPSYTAGLRRNREIDVLAYRSQGSRATFIGSTYGKRVPSFTMAQKGSDSSWAAKPVEHSSERLVETVSIRIGPAGSKRPARARIYANCKSDQGTGAAPGNRCERRDVARFGGALVLLARTNSGGVPTATDIRIDTTGLSYRQLLRIARGLRPVG